MASVRTMPIAGPVMSQNIVFGLAAAATGDLQLWMLGPAIGILRVMFASPR